jgi:membrane protein required for colicin V production
MTTYDAVMVGLVIVGMIWGAFRGLVWHLASLASLVLGYVFGHPVSEWLAPHLPGEAIVARVLGMILTYVVIAAAVFAIAWVIRLILKRLDMLAFDRHLGMVLGGVEAGILGVVGTMFVTSLAPETREVVFGSPTGRVVGRIMDGIGPALPAEVRSTLQAYWSEEVPAKSTSPMRIASRPESDTTSKSDTSEGVPKAARANPSRDSADSVPSPLREESPKSRLGRLLVDSLDRELKRMSSDDPEPRDR